MDDLRFPVGEFVPPGTWHPAQVAEWQEVIVALPQVLRSAVAGLDAAALDTPYREGGWSVRQLVHHVADSHLHAYARFKLALTEEHPTIRPYDQDKWAALPDSLLLDITPSLDILEGLHARWALLISTFTESDLARTYLHPEHDASFTLGHALAMYAWHCTHHTAHIHALRARKGW